MTRALLDSFITPKALAAHVAAARVEDLGTRGRDVTSDCIVPKAARATAVFRARKPGIVAGLAVLPAVIEAFDPAVLLHPAMKDGTPIEAGMDLAAMTGPLASILAIERTALNYLTYLSGIASLTGRFVAAVEGTAAVILDTRKTIPGTRALAKYAVVCGGGKSHRMGLHDAVLIKDNHLALLPAATLADALAAAIRKARAARAKPAFVEVEVDTLDQLKIVLPCQPDIVLLDNMDPRKLREAVKLRDAHHAAGGSRIALEASGGVDLTTVRKLAEAGVDRISIGALTHSAPALDIGLDIDA